MNGSFRLASPSAVLCVLAAVIASAVSQATAAPADYKKMMEEKGPSYVTLKYVLKFQQQEIDGEIAGVMISPDGLVLCSNALLGGGPGAPPSINVSDVKVLIGDDTEGIDATLMTRDSDLDLAWVKIKEPKGPYKHVDINQHTPAQVGENACAMMRMGKFFDRVPAIAEFKIAGQASKPRDLYFFMPPQMALRSLLGMPVYGSSGTLVGVVALQFPENQDGGDGGPVILPMKTVAKATTRAKETAKAAEEAAAAEKAADDAADEDADEDAGSE